MAGIDLGLTVTFFNSASAGLRSLAGDVKKVGDNAQATHNRLRAIQVVLAGIILQKSIELGKAFTAAAAANQMLNVRMQTFAGGASAAARVQDELNKHFSATVFNIDEVGKSWIKLTNALGNSSKATAVIKAIGDDVSALGGDSQNLDQVANALARMSAKGLASTRELNSILDNTGLTLNDLAKGAGQSTNEFARNLQNGFVTASQFTDAFVSASKSKFGDYATLLSSTVGGAMKRFENSFNEAFDLIGKNTNVNAQLAVFFNQLADAVVKFAAGMKQSDIDVFFNFLRSMGPVVVNVGSALLNVVRILGSISSWIANLFGSLPPIVFELGIIGYLLFGLEGVGLVLLLGKIDNMLGGIVAKALTFAQSKFMGVTDRLSGLGGNPADTAQWQAMIDGMEKSLATLGKFKAGTTGSTENTTHIDDALKARVDYVNDLKSALQGAIDNLDILNQKSNDNKLGVEIANATKQTDTWKASIQNILDKNNALKKPLGPNDEGYEVFAKLSDLIKPGGSIQNGLDAWLAHLRDAQNMNNIILEQEEHINQMQLQRSILLSQRSTITSPGFNLLAGTSGGQAALDVEQKKYDLSVQIEEAQGRIFEIDRKMKENVGNDVVLQALSKTRELEVEFQKATVEAMQSMTAQGEIVKEEWKQIGGILENDIADGISGLAKHMTTLGDITTKIFNDMTDAAARYLVKLLEAQAFGTGGGGGGLLSGIFGGGGQGVAGVGGFLAGLFGNGAAFAGNVKPFTRGDVITGPTLFGIAGEADTEAIMPLERVGGKLGVRSTGGGGANHIHIHAIDTQSGVEFLYKHIDDVDQMLGHRRLINRNSKQGM